MKTNDETDAQYMVRVLLDNFNAAAKEESKATIRREAAFEALMLAERTARYLEDLAAKQAKRAESK